LKPKCFEEKLDTLLILQVLLHAKMNRKLTKIPNLTAVEFKAFSQWGEDGIIDWLVAQLPGIPESFIEFGVQNYRECNTRLLCRLHNWRGLVMDSSEEDIAAIRRQNIFWKHDIEARPAFITPENINPLIGESGLIGDIGLLSIDIDGNDFWVWQAIEVVRPWIVICEYNALFGDIQPVSIPFLRDFQRTKAHNSNLYFGASIRALEFLAHQKGYVLVGTNSAGCNAFFVRTDKSCLVTNSLENVCIHGSRIRQSRAADGRLTGLRGERQLSVIAEMPLVDVITDETKRLVEINDLWSELWQRRYA
jgi:hypothetical protein